MGNYCQKELRILVAQYKENLFLTHVKSNPDQPEWAALLVVFPLGNDPETGTVSVGLIQLVNKGRNSRRILPLIFRFPPGSDTCYLGP